MSHLDSNRPQYRGQSKTMRPQHLLRVCVEVIFGTPGKNCQGAGICRLLPVEPVRVRWKCPSTRAWLCTNLDGSISLCFDRRTLLRDDCEHYFVDGVFHIEEAYPLPKAIISLLNRGDFTMDSGQYSLEVSDYSYFVNF